MTEKYGPTLPISEEIHSMKYRMKGETFEDCINRIVSTLSDDEGHLHQLKQILMEQRFMPAGRIQASAGSPRKATLFNCFVSSTIKDSFDGIMKVATEAGRTMRMGGGIGYDFSTLRPRGDLIKSLDSQSSGPVSFMDIFNAICGTIAASGHRRGAMMGVMRVDHPDIMEFIQAKQNSTRLTNFNVSVAVTDAFMEAVKNKTDFPLVFGGREYARVDAEDLWNQIMRGTWDYAEPQSGALCQ